MTSERVQRQIDRLLDEAEAALAAGDWQTVQTRAEAVLRLDPDNADATTYLRAATRDVATTAQGRPAVRVETPESVRPEPVEGREPLQPATFANGRYVVKRFLGEGGKKRVYLAHDTRLDRDVAFALIKTEGLDAAARERITREAQAMGRLGNHPNIVTVYDIGEEQEQPFLVLPVLEGGDVEGLIEKAPEHKLPIDQAIRIGADTCEGLEILHSKGLVHRDVKPGNTWLTNDGRAMIGDFGLAVAVDRSRLTQAGMMVGTVSYMAPEQAMGGEVTPRADLYALGAMLYEMVCGRPPFVGDESVAIIGQHLNTPPVAPSWHRPDCPPALEALILRLLEKDPNKRPSSAAEVCDALRSIPLSPLPREGEGEGEGAASRQSITASSVAADPLYRTVFVGREAELKQLQSAFDAAVSGQGGLVMVVGEPGIGKTAVCQQLQTYVSLRGGRTLVGHCYEEGSLSLPYLAFVEAMRTYVLARDPDGLRSDLGSGAADVARIVSEVRDRVAVELRDAGDPEDDRWRLLQSVTTFLRNASSVQPLVIVLEDLHWADRGTLDLLQHVARNLQGARLLVVGTYRDVEVDRAHPLSSALAELRRSGSFLRVPLRGLTVDEVHRMYEAIRGNEVPWAQAELVYRQTEGNPLFVQEVLRYLVEEGYVVREEGRYMAKAPGEGVPEGLRDVIGRRLSHLDEKANQVLAAASVIGRDFRLDVLQKVAGLSEEDLYVALEEATGRAIVEQVQAPSGIAFRFTHAMFRQLLYQEIFAPRRIRLHQQVGNALEEVHARRLEEHAAELAEHFSQSTETADLEKAVRYGELAAQRAMGVFDYGEAARFLAKVMDVHEVLGSDDELKVCELLLKLADALMLAGEPLKAVEGPLEQAFSLAEGLAHSDYLARSFVLAFDGLARGLEGLGLLPHPQLRNWVDRSDRYLKQGTVDRVNADLAIVQLLIANGRWREANARAIDALEVAQGHRDSLATLRIAVALRTHLAVWLIEQSLRLADDTTQLRTEQSHRQYAAHVGSVIPLYLATGNKQKADTAYQALESFFTETRDPYALLWLLECQVQLSAIHGDMGAARETLKQLAESSTAYGSPERGRFIGVFADYVPLIYLGQAGQFLALCSSHLTQAERRSPLVWSRAIAALAHSGRTAEGEAELSDFLQTYEVFDGDAPALMMSDLLEASLLLGREVLVHKFADILARTKFMLVPSDREIRCVGRHLGAAFALRGEQATARSFYEGSLEACEAIGFRPEVALLRLHLAELLLSAFPDERAEAIQHLDSCTAEFREMAMRAALERSISHRGLLKA
jgi:hypothetical protein